MVHTRAQYSFSSTKPKPLVQRSNRNMDDNESFTCIRLISRFNSIRRMSTCYQCTAFESHVYVRDIIAAHRTMKNLCMAEKKVHFVELQMQVLSDRHPKSVFIFNSVDDSLPKEHFGVSYRFALI